MPNFTHSREAKIKRRIYLFTIATVVVLVLLFIWGVPLLVRISEFWWFLGSAGKPPVTQNQQTTPLPPRLDQLEPATSSAKIDISGFTQPGATVEIFADGTSRGKITVGTDGIFNLKDYTLQTGENKFWAISENNLGIKSKPSNTVSIIYDKNPPPLEITSPGSGKIYTGSPKEAKITGKTDSDATVTINDFWAIVNQEGEFSYNLSLNDGENTVRITARDLAGNKTTKEIKVWYNP